MSGNAAASNIENFIYVTLNAFMQTTVNFVGQNYGAKQYDRVKKSFLACFAGALIVGVIIGLLAYSFAPQLLSIYITDSDAAIAAGVTRMTYVCLPYFLCGLMEVTTGAIRGLGASFVTMVISVMGVVGVRITWLYTVFPAFNTLESLFTSYIVSWTFTIICQFTAFFVVYKKKMARAAVSNPIATRNVVVRADFRRNRLENRLNERPSFRVAAGHQARAFASALFAAGDAAPDEANPAFGEEFNAAFGVFEVRVAAVDRDVARFEVRQKRVENGVDRGAIRVKGVFERRNRVFRGNHHQDFARRRQLRREFFERVSAGQRVALRLCFVFREEFVGLRGREVVNGDTEAAVDHIKSEVLAHHAGADEADIVFFLGHKTLRRQTLPFR